MNNPIFDDKNLLELVAEYVCDNDEDRRVFNLVCKNFYAAFVMKVPMARGLKMLGPFLHKVFELSEPRKMFFDVFKRIGVVPIPIARQLVKTFVESKASHEKKHAFSSVLTTQCGYFLPDFSSRVVLYSVALPFEENAFKGKMAKDPLENRELFINIFTAFVNNPNHPPQNFDIAVNYSSIHIAFGCLTLLEICKMLVDLGYAHCERLISLMPDKWFTISDEDGIYNRLFSRADAKTARAFLQKRRKLVNLEEYCEFVSFWCPFNLDIFIECATYDNFVEEAVSTGCPALIAKLIRDGTITFASTAKYYVHVTRKKTLFTSLWSIGLINGFECVFEELQKVHNFKIGYCIGDLREVLNHYTNKKAVKWFVETYTKNKTIQEIVEFRKDLEGLYKEKNFKKKLAKERLEKLIENINTIIGQKVNDESPVKKSKFSSFDFE